MKNKILIIIYILLIISIYRSITLTKEKNNLINNINSNYIKEDPSIIEKNREYLINRIEYLINKVNN